MKFKPYQQHQPTMFPNSIEELVPKDHLVRGIDKIIEEINLVRLYDSYGEEGQPAYHPKMLIKVLIYGYSIGVRSSRKLADKLGSDVYFMYLSGNQRPDFRTISDFRLNKREYLQDCFLEVLRVCKEMEMYTLGHISIDGSKIKANASKYSTYSEEDLERYEERIKRIIKESEEIDQSEDERYGKDKSGYELPEEINTEEKLIEKIRQAKQKLKEEKQKEEKLKRINTTDSDSRLMKTNSSGRDMCYNSQLSVDSDNQIIVACDVSNQSNDIHLFPSMYEKTKEITESELKEVSADAGYYCGEIYQYIESNEIDAYLPEKNFENEVSKTGEETIPKYDRRNFRQIEDGTEYICPEGKTMRYDRWRKKKNGVKSKVYIGTQCLECKSRSECITNKGGKYRYINIYENEKFRKKMREKLKSQAGREKYNIRLKTVEPVFAQLKHIMGFNRFMLRGLEKVKSEFSLICTSYNIKKIISYINKKNLALST